MKEFDFNSLFDLCNSMSTSGEAKHYLKSKLLKRPITEERNETLIIRVKL